jgi:hypothetical protein
LTVAVDPENCWLGGISVLFDKEPGATGALDVAPIVLWVEFDCKPPFAQIVMYLPQFKVTLMLSRVRHAWYRPDCPEAASTDER